MSTFASALIAWQRVHGRRGLPWQGTRDPYRIWLAEVMLQQTQVGAVIPYYRRFLKKYATVERLAAASEDDVLRLWSGLGYYARGRNLHAAAKLISRSAFPQTAREIAELPGVGRSTAAAIAAFAFGERAAILDGNVKRVLSRVFALSDEENLWKKAEKLLPRADIEIYTQALMDLGATVCTRTNPRCALCPVREKCVARKSERIHELPLPRARKTLPLRHAAWFVYCCDGKVLLQRRPSRGLWGGLWTFPEMKVFPGRTTKLPQIEHGFTHFRLRAQPILCEVGKNGVRPHFPACYTKQRKMGSDPIFLWVPLNRAPQQAVPAPVRTLLERLQGAR